VKLLTGQWSSWCIEVTFLNTRPRISFTGRDTDCLTRKLMSSLLLVSDSEGKGPDEGSSDSTAGSEFEKKDGMPPL